MGFFTFTLKTIGKVQHESLRMVLLCFEEHKFAENYYGKGFIRYIISFHCISDTKRVKFEGSL